MAQEPRNIACAHNTEALIQGEVLSEGPGIYSIRNIECRSSICAVEVESTADAYISASNKFLTDNDLIDGLIFLGPP
jgi:hypothetical protein